MKKIMFLYAYLILSLHSFSIEYSLEELTEMYNQNILTKEDYGKNRGKRGVIFIKAK